MKKFVKLPELKLKKETIAKLSKAKMNDVKGGILVSFHVPCVETLLPDGCYYPLYGVDI